MTSNPWNSDDPDTEGRNEWNVDDRHHVDDDHDGEDAFDDETVPCPACGADVYEDSPWCHACGTYITHSTSPWKGRPWWWIVLGVIGVAATIWLMLPF